VKETVGVSTMDNATTCSTVAALLTSLSATIKGDNTSPMKSLNVMTTLFGGISYLFNTASVNKQFDDVNWELELLSLKADMASVKADMASVKADMASLERELASLKAELFSLEMKQNFQQIQQMMSHTPSQRSPMKEKLTQKLLRGKGTQSTQGKQSNEEIDQSKTEATAKHSDAMVLLERKMNELNNKKLELERKILKKILEKELYIEERKVQTPQVRDRVKDLQNQIKNMSDDSDYFRLE
jgi:chromosome segregation ATPase